MTCTSCGDKPKGSSKGFPKAVVEINNPESLVLLRKVVIPVSMGTEEDVPPAIGKYFNVLLQYESNGHIYLYSSDGIPTPIEANIPQEVLDRIDQLEIDVDLLETGLANETEARETADTALGGRIDTVANNLATETANRISADEDLQADIAAEATARANADTALNTAITAEAATRQTADAGLQSQIDAITASSDVKDIVGTKAELNNYDTSTLGNNDIIKVLQDESENNATTYYRWNATTQQFTLVGEEGPYYTKSQADTLLNAKQNTLTAGSNVQIVNDTISATDTTYTAGTGLALNGTQFSVDTTAIATQSDLTAGLATKQDTLTAGTNIQINNNTISATDTTYSDFTGTDGTAAGTAGLVPAPATTDAGKFLKADGTWDTAGGGGNIVYSTVTTSNTTNGGAVYIGDKDANQAIQSDPTSTDNHYKYFWALPNSTSNMPRNNTVNIMGNTNNYGSGSVSILGLGAAQDSVEIGNQAYAEGVNSVAIGKSSDSRTNGVAIGEQANGRNYSVSIGSSAGLYSAGNMVSCVNIGNRAGLNSQSGNDFSVNLGANSRGTRKGEVNVGLVTGNTTSGYNDSAYRVIGGVYDGQLDHDVVTVGQLNGRILQNAGAPTTATVGAVGQLLEDTTNGKLYQCTAVDTTDPNNPSYTWSEVGAGGGSGPTVVQTTGTSQADVMSQNAATSMVFADPATATRVSIGNANAGAGAVSIGQSAYGAGEYSVALGYQANTYAGNGAVALGQSARARAANAVAIGYNSIIPQGTDNIALGTSAQTAGNVMNAIALGGSTVASHRGSVALGSSAQTTVKGQIMVGTTNIYDGYNSTNYRIISGVHDAQSDNDAVNLGQLNGRVLQNAGAPTTSTVGTVGQLLEDTTNGKLYQCTAIDTTDPQNPSYTWTEVGAGGGGGAEFIELTTADYNWNSSTGQTGTPNCVALWLLPSGIYKGPASTSIEVRATRTQDYSMGAGFSSYAIVKECENTNTNRAIVTYVDGANGNVVEYYSIDENGQNYSTKNFPNVVQSTGTSTTGVMSQNAVTSELYPQYSSKTKGVIGIGDYYSIANYGDTKIGIGRITLGNNSAYALAINSGDASGTVNSISGIGIWSGTGGTVTGASGIAIGSGSSVSGKGGVAIGRNSSASTQGEFNIGSSDNSYGYNSSNYRLLTGLYDPQSAHDAATKGYVDTAVAGAGASAFTTNEWNALWA